MKLAKHVDGSYDGLQIPHPIFSNVSSYVYVCTRTFPSAIVIGMTIVAIGATGSINHPSPIDNRHIISVSIDFWSIGDWWSFLFSCSFKFGETWNVRYNFGRMGAVSTQSVCQSVSLLVCPSAVWEDGRTVRLVGADSQTKQQAHTQGSNRQTKDSTGTGIHTYGSSKDSTRRRPSAGGK